MKKISCSILSDNIYSELTKVYPMKEARNLALFYLREKLFLSSMDFLLKKEVVYDENIVKKDIERLLAFEPVQYVLGKTWFYDLEFYVNQETLIPRPETEELVDLIKNTKDLKPLSIWDLGTGSGCIAISLAKIFPKSKVLAVDVNEEALKVVSDNIELNRVNVEALKKDVLNDDFSTLGKVDVIVSNPPYIGEDEKKLMHKNVLEYEPHLALFVPTDNVLLFYDKIAHIAKEALNEGGYLFFELNEHYGDETKNLLDSLGFTEVKIHLDLQGKKRMISCRK